MTFFLKIPATVSNTRSLLPTGFAVPLLPLPRLGAARGRLPSRSGRRVAISSVAISSAAINQSAALQSAAQGRRAPWPRSGTPGLPPCPQHRTQPRRPRHRQRVRMQQMQRMQRMQRVRMHRAQAEPLAAQTAL